MGDLLLPAAQAGQLRFFPGQCRLKLGSPCIRFLRFCLHPFQLAVQLILLLFRRCELIAQIHELLHPFECMAAVFLDAGIFCFDSFLQVIPFSSGLFYGLLQDLILLFLGIVFFRQKAQSLFLPGQLP